jgi:hypothetical protein
MDDRKYSSSPASRCAGLGSELDSIADDARLPGDRQGSASPRNTGNIDPQ